MDLPSGEKSGLVEAVQVLNGIKGIEFVHLTHRDVVRHELVMSIIRAMTNIIREGLLLNKKGLLLNKRRD